MNLTAENVSKTFLKCLFADEEPKDKRVVGEGVMVKAGFHPERLEANRENIFSMLTGLPKEFQQSEGGGMSFLNACNDKDGNQWADLHQTIDQLLALGIASGQAKMLMPREMWGMLPGCMPYFVVLDSVPIEDNK